MNVAELLYSIAQNDYMIDGYYLQTGRELRSAARYHNRLRAALRDALDTIDACGSINVEKARALLAKGERDVLENGT